MAPATRVVIAESAGACYGVERALAIVARAAREAPGAVRTLGPLIHNPVVVAELAAAGVRAIDEPREAAGETLVLRAHGVTPAVETEARGACARVIDATCPFVARAQRMATELAEAGYQVVVVGDSGHPEVEGTLARAPGAIVAAGATEPALRSVGRRVGVVAQTTTTHDRLRAVVGALVGRVAELRVVDTICAATSERQRAARELAARVDAMVVIGGRNSANTARLVEICGARCASVCHVESVDELDADLLADASVIGVTAGASTPRSQIDAVVAAIRARADA